MNQLLSKKIFVAVFVVVVFLCLVCLSGNNFVKDLLSNMINEQKIFSENDLFASLDMYEKNGSQIKNTTWKEVIDINKVGGKNYKSDAEEKVIGFTVNGESHNVFLEIKREVCNHGWIYIESGNTQAATFTKNSGDYKWLFVNCQKIETQTEVVMIVE